MNRNYYYFNYKYMKKYLLVFLLAVFIIPSLTFAPWWNPLNPPKMCPAWGCGPVPFKPISVTSST